MRKTILMGAFIGAAAFRVLGQPALQVPAFEVASVRPHQGPIPTEGGRVTISGPRLTITTHMIAGLLVFAYNVKPYQISDRASLDRTFYDVAAQAPDGSTPTRDDFRLMMQALLADRFRLKVHREMVDTPVYTLVVNKGGHKFKESAPDAPDASRIEVNGPNFVWIYPKVAMEQLSLRITNVDGIGRPVVDKTGLTGNYAIKLTYTPEYRRGRGGDPTGEITIFEAVQQLGLKLQPQNAPVEMLFVDHIEKPTEN